MKRIQLLTDWEESLEGYGEIPLVGAHCDNRVLHAPGECEYCDHYPEAQQWRIDYRVNFTGGRSDLLKPCPAEKARGLKHLYGWGGNQPRGDGVPEDYKQALSDIERPSSKMFYDWIEDES